MRTAEWVLREAAETLELVGWCQGILTNDRGQYCAAGAIRRAVNEGNYQNEGAAVTACVSAVETLEAEVGQTIVDWNDTPGRTSDEVIAAMRYAAERVEAQA